VDQHPNPDPARRDDAEDPASAGSASAESASAESPPPSSLPSSAGPPTTDWDDDGGDGWDGLPACFPEDDFDADAEMARFVADIESGRERIPAPWEVAGPAVSISLGDAADLDPALLAAMTGPDGLAGESFDQNGEGSALRPGPVLSALVEQASGDLAALTDDQVLGLMSGAVRLRNRAEYLKLHAVAEFTRRRAAQFEAAKSAKVRPGRRDGEFPDSDLAMELMITRNAAGQLIDMAADLDTRLPRAFERLASGDIDGDRAYAIWLYTKSLSDVDAATADEILAEVAPDLRYDQLARKAAALEMKLDPEAARLRKEKARKDNGRVEVGREASGNASLSGRELGIADVLSAKANIDAIAARLRRSGVAKTLRELRVQVYTDLLQGRDPLGRPADAANTRTVADTETTTGHEPSGFPAPDESVPDEPAVDDPGAESPEAGDPAYAYCGPPGGGRWPPGAPAADGTGGEGPQYLYLGADKDDEDDEDGDDEDDEDEQAGKDGKAKRGSRAGSGSSPGSGRPAAPLPALINFIVPIGTALGFSSAPGSIGSVGLTDAVDTQELLQAASQDPRTRCCVTVIGPDGTAVAHGCARGQQPWPPAPPPDSAPPPDPAPPGTAPPTTEPPGDGGDQVRARQAAQVTELLRRLNVVLEPIARESCDHRHREDRYRPSRALQHLVRARTLTCSAPGCGAQAVHSDLDHVVPYPDGPTDECNLHPACRRHHRCKQAPGWRVEQAEPGVVRWTTPSGRTYTSKPTVYDAE